MTIERDSHEVRLSLLTELAEASVHLANGTTDATALHDPNLASSIDSVRLQSNDLMRKRMRELRLAAGLTQAELASRAGVPRHAVSDFETGRAVVSDLVATIAPVLGVVGANQPVESSPKGKKRAESPTAASSPKDKKRAESSRAESSRAESSREQSSREHSSTVVLRARTAAAGEDPVEFEVVASGTSMEPTVRHGDLLLVSPRIALEAGRIVVAKHGETWLVKRLAHKGEALVLRSDNAHEELALAEVAIQGTVVELRRTL